MARDVSSRFRDPRFVSFIADNNRSLMDTDFHEALLKGRRFVRQLLIALLVVGAAWVLVESARAISVF